MQFIVNPLAPVLDALADSGGIPGSITITGNDNDPQTSASFVILGTDGLSFDWDGDLGAFVITNNDLGFTWNSIPGVSVTAEKNNGYVLTNTNPVTVTLPANVDTAFGDTFKVIGLSGGFDIAQAASQNIRIGEQITSSGAGTKVTSSGGTFSSMTLVCVSTAGGVFVWATDGAPQGNFIIT